MASTPKKTSAAPAKTAATGSPAPASSAPKKPRKAREQPMTLLQKLALYDVILAASPTMTDATLAAALSKQFSRDIPTASVKRWRLELGLVSVAKKSAAELELELEEAQARIAELETILGEGSANKAAGAAAGAAAAAGDPA